MPCSFRVTGTGCVPENAVSCDEELSCQPGSAGYTCSEDQLVHERLGVPPYTSALFLMPNTDCDGKLISLSQPRFQDANLVDLHVEAYIKF